MTIDRDWLQERYIQWDLNKMSNEELRQFFIDTQNRELGDLDDDELIYEVEQYAPELFVWHLRKNFYSLHLSFGFYIGEHV